MWGEGRGEGEGREELAHAHEIEPFQFNSSASLSLFWSIRLCFHGLFFFFFFFFAFFSFLLHCIECTCRRELNQAWTERAVRSQAGSFSEANTFLPSFLLHFQYMWLLGGIAYSLAVRHTMHRLYRIHKVRSLSGVVRSGSLPFLSLLFSLALSLSLCTDI